MQSFLHIHEADKALIRKKSILKEHNRKISSASRFSLPTLIVELNKFKSSKTNSFP